MKKASLQPGPMSKRLTLPIFSRMIKLKEDVAPLVATAFRILISGAIFLAALSWFFGEDILNLLYEANVPEATKPFQVLMLCFVAVASNYIFGTLLTANGDLKALNIVAFSGMVGNIILNLILIPKYMVLGAALASLITQVFTSSVQFILVVTNFKLKINWKLILRFAIYLLLLFPIMKLISEMNLSLYLKFGLEFTLFAILVSTTGIISPRSFYLLIKTSKE